MRNKEILFLNSSGKRPIEKVVCRALLSTGSGVLIVNQVDEARRHIQEHGVDLFLVNYDDADFGTIALIKETMDGPGDFPTVLVSEKKDKGHLINVFSHDQLRNLIARNDLVSEQELIITVEKLLRRDIFGMNKYFTWGVHFIEEPVVDSFEKSNQVARVADFVRSLKCDERFVRLAEIVADELLMNALYDAPVDAKGNALYSHLPRNERVQLRENQAFLQYGSDGRYFGISCRDHFGALHAHTIVQYLRKCFAHDEYQVDQKKGGAGVGFFMIFQSISQLVVNIDPGRMTETIGLIDIRMMYRETKARSKSFNIFVREP